MPGMSKTIDDATFLFLQKQEKERKKMGLPIKPPKYNLVRMKRGGKCATKKEDARHKKEGWVKVGCGMWIMPVEID